MKILNLFSGIGGNRKLWSKEHYITAVECDKNIAQAYSDRFPGDTVIIGDAKEYLLEHYKEFDFIWASPPCQSHGKVRKAKVDCKPNKKGTTNAIYPDMSLYEIIIFLQHYFKGKWIVENTSPYYKPLIEPTKILDRHLYWCNFNISDIKIEKDYKIERVRVSDLTDFDLSKYKNISNKQQVIRNQVNYKLGNHILNCALNKIEENIKIIESELNLFNYSVAS